MTFTFDINQLIATIISAAAGGLAAYVAIRTDLADLKARMINVEDTAKNSHLRIDKILHRE
jgi:hypothetical protein